jgi:hypothetical protein
LDPQIAGELGGRTVLDSTTHPPVVRELEYVLDQPEADDLIQSFPVFLVGVDLARRLQEAGLSGVGLAEAVVRPSAEYTAAYGRAPHRSYRRLQPGNVGEDCWVDDSGRLCVSDRMMRILDDAELSDCLVSEIRT